MKRQNVIEVIALLFFILFIYTATSKIIDYRRFVFQMRLAPLPILKQMAPIIGWALPLVELVIAIGLLIKKYREKALYMSVVLMVIFELYIGSMLLFNRQLPCTCGGIISQMSWHAHVIFNALLITLGVIALRQIKQIRKFKSFNPE